MKVLWVWLTFMIVTFYARGTLAARILAIFPIYSRSHYSIHRKIFLGLASRGHQVTVVAPFGENNATTANYIHADISDMLSSFSFVDSKNTTDTYSTGTWKVLNSLEDFEAEPCKRVLSLNILKEAVQLAKVGQKTFDLVLAEMYHNPCYLPLAIALDVPIIWSITPVLSFGIDRFTGSPDNPSYIPVISGSFTSGMNFYERVINLYEYALYYIYHSLFFDLQTMEIFTNEYPESNIPMEDMFKKVSLAFTYGHPVLLSKPKVPNVIEIGGLHIDEPKALPQELETFIKESENGVIYFSFGSTIKASSIPDTKLNVFREVFSRIPQRILWRCDNMNTTGFTSNVKVSNWFPQRDILEHQNVKAFISHGGLLGMYEAISTATPLVGIPFAYDQRFNTKTLAKKEAAVYIDFESLTSEILLNAINEVTGNPKYVKNMKKLSAILKDRPMSALDTVIYWTEYVLRHNGAPHLRSAGADLPLYQYLLLDVIGFILLMIALSFYFLKVILCKTITIAGIYPSAKRHAD